MASLSLGSVS